MQTLPEVNIMMAGKTNLQGRRSFTPSILLNLGHKFPVRIIPIVKGHGKLLIYLMFAKKIIQMLTLQVTMAHQHMLPSINFISENTRMKAKCMADLIFSAVVLCFMMVLRSVVRLGIQAMAVATKKRLI